MDEEKVQEFLHRLSFGNAAQLAAKIVETAEKRDAELFNSLKNACGHGDEDLQRVADVLLGAADSNDRLQRKAAIELLCDAEKFTQGSRQYCLRVPELSSFTATLIRGLVKALKKPDHDTRLNVLASLGRLVTFAPDMIISATAEVAFADRHAEIVVKAINVVLLVGVDHASIAIPALLRLLRHEASEVRQRACTALSQFGPEADSVTVDILPLVLTAPSRQEQVQAALALSKIDQSGEKTIENVVSSRDRCHLLELLRSMGEDGRPLRLTLQQQWGATGGVRCCVVIKSKMNRKVTVYGKDTTLKTPQQLNVVAALIAVFPGKLTKDQLVTTSGHSDAVRILKRIEESSDDWRRAIVRGGSTGDGYRLSAE